MKKLLLLPLALTLQVNAQKGFYGVAMYSAPNVERSAIVRTDTNGQNYMNVSVFPGYQNQFETTERAYPYETLGDGSFFAGNEYGGPNYKGTIFSYNPVANTTQVIYDFHNAPNGAARPANTPVKVNNLLIGTTLIGGQGQMGTAYMYNLTTQQYTEIHTDFTAINRPSGERLAVGANGKIYGTTSSHLFEIDLSDTSLNVLWSYSAFAPEQGSNLVESGGNIYMVRINFSSPVLFKYEISSGVSSTISLTGNGEYPTGLCSDGNGGVYVYNSSGSAAGDRGVLVHVSSSEVITPYSLPAPAALSTTNLIYSNLTRNANGEILLCRNSDDSGVNYNVWAFTPSSQTFDTVYTSLNYLDGNDIKTISEIGNNQYLIGAASGILAENSWPGGIIVIDAANNSRLNNLLFYFAPMGVYEGSRLKMNTSGTLAYGCNFYGGNGENGVLFSFDGEQVNKLYDFSENGINYGPYSTFYDLGDGMLYGFSTSGGVHQRGYIYRFNPADTTFTIVHHTTHRTQAAVSNGSRLYVLSNSGGTVNGIDRHLGYWDAGTGTYTVVANILPENGNSIRPELAVSADGDTVYFSSVFGGANSYGAFSRIIVSAGSNTVLHDFQANHTKRPFTSPLVVNDKVYMLCGGSVFMASPEGESTLSTNSLYLAEWDNSSDTLRILETFDDQVYGNGDATMLLHANNKLYFTTVKQQTIRIIRYDLGTQNYTVSSTNGDTLGMFITFGLTELCFVPKASATAISGPSTLTENQPGILYEVANPKGHQLTWSYSGTGVTLSPSGDQVTVSATTGATSGTLTVTAKNECGEAEFATLQITIEQDLFVESISTASPELFPNPTTEGFFIKHLEEEVQFQIIDLQGRIVQQGNAIPGKETQLHQLPSGLYMVKFTTKANGEQTLKLLVH